MLPQQTVGRGLCSSRLLQVKLYCIHCIDNSNSSVCLATFVIVCVCRKRSVEQELTELLKEKEEQIAGLMEEGLYDFWLV